MMSLWLRLLFMIVSYFMGLVTGAVLLGVIASFAIHAGDMEIYVRDSETGNWEKLLDEEAEPIN